MKKTVSLLFAFIIIFSALCFSVSAEASSAGKCDINGDGSVDAADYIIVKRIVLRNTDIEGIEVSAADVNGDGSVDSADYIIVKRVVIGNYKSGAPSDDTPSDPPAAPEGNTGSSGESTLPPFARKSENGLLFRRSSATSGLELTGIGDCTDKTVVIPEEVEGEKVTAIGRNAFAKTDITGVIIPETVTVVGDCAFAGCDSLKEIVFPDRVTTVGNESLINCAALERVSFGKSVENIAVASAYNSPGIFSGCTSLKEVNVDPENVHFVVKDGCLIRTDDNCLVAAVEGAVIPDDGSVETIGKRAFYGAAWLKEIVIPSAVKSIGPYAFYNCVSLVSAELPDSLETLGSNAFMNCSSLENIDIPGSLDEIGADAFFNCTSLGAATIGEGVRQLSMGAFSGCESLTELTVPASVEIIQRYAFKNCKSLEKLYMRSDASWTASTPGVTIYFFFWKFSFDTGDKRVFDAAGDPEKCAEAFTETFVDYNFQLNKTE